MEKRIINFGELGYISSDEMIADYEAKNRPFAVKENVKIIYKWTWLGLREQKTKEYCFIYK